MSGGGKGGDSQTTGYRYFMDVHMGLFRGPLNFLKEIKVGDRQAWKGLVTDNDVIEIDEPKLFGGDKSEGGIKGDLHVWFGAPTQVLDTDIKNNISDPCPDFRGVATLYYSGQISANNPYPKTWEMRCARTTAGWDAQDPWYPEKATIELAGDLPEDEDDPDTVHAMNPAHIIYECFTNRSWGKGWPRSFMDDAAFRKAADTLFTEQFGMCIKWNRQDKISTFVRQVLDHIGGGVWVDRGSGLLTINLIRADYDPNTVPLFDYNSGLLEILRDDSSAPATNINELIVKYRNPISNEDLEVRVQNLASVQSAGKTTSTVEYPGLPVASLALRIAQRDCRMFAYGLRRYTLTMDRRAWKLAPTKVLRIADPQRGLINMVLRVAEVEDKLDDDGEGTITVKAIQDVFGLTATAFAARQPPLWRPPDTTPVGSAFRNVQEVSYRDLAHALTTAELQSIESDQGAVLTVAAKPSGLALNYAIWSKTGAEQYIQRDVADWCPTGTLLGPAGLYDTSLTLTGMSGVNSESVVEGQALFVDDEIMKLVSRVGGVLTVERGCADTLPQPHSTGARVWLYDRFAGTDNREYVASETVSLKLLTHTSTGDQDLASAPEDTVTMNRRQVRPYPPGNMKLNGTLYGNVATVKGNITFTWAHRDRLSQDDALINHLAGSIGPEAGTTYTLRFYNGVTLLRTESGLAGTTYLYDYDKAEVDGWVPNLTFELEASRAGFVSRYKYQKTIGHTPLGPFRPIIITASGEVGSTNPFVFGTADAGSSVQLYVGIYPAGVANGSPVLADGSGNWSKTLTGLLGGANNIYAIASNVDGPSPPSLSKTLTVVWYNPSASLTIDFQGNRFRLNGVVTSPALAADWIALFNNALTTPAQIARKANGDLVYFAANAMPLITGEGFRDQPARTNRNLNQNAAITVTTNVTKTGNASAVLSVVADATELSSGRFADPSMASVMNGSCLQLDNTLGGAGDARAVLGGAVGVTTACAFSVYVRGGAGRIETTDAVPVVLATFGASSGYQRVEASFTPSATTIQVAVVSPLGSNVKFVLNTLEAFVNPTDPIANPGGATVTRASPNIRRTLGAEFNPTEGFLVATHIQSAGAVNNGVIASVLAADDNNAHVIQTIGETLMRGTTLNGAVAQAQLSTAMVPASLTRTVFGFKAADWASSSNGGAAVTDTAGTMPSGSPRLLRVGANTGNGNFCGTIRRIELGNAKPTNAEIERMSGWALL